MNIKLAVDGRGEYVIIREKDASYLAFRATDGTNWHLNLVEILPDTSMRLVLVGKFASIAECEEAATEDAQERWINRHPNT